MEGFRCVYFPTTNIEGWPDKSGSRKVSDGGSQGTDVAEVHLTMRQQGDLVLDAVNDDTHVDGKSIPPHSDSVSAYALRRRSKSPMSVILTREIEEVLRKEELDNLSI